MDESPVPTVTLTLRQVRELLGMNRPKVVRRLAELDVKRTAGSIRTYEGGWARPGSGLVAAWETVLGLPPGSIVLPPRDDDAGEQDEPAEAAMEPRAA